jgi:hypothetical protein
VRGDGKRKLAVFEDPNCGYCKRFERDLTSVNNVTVYLFLYPVLGRTPSPSRATSGAPRTRPKPGTTGCCATPRPPTAECDTAAIKRNREFGQKYNITGTPTLIFADGSRAPGAISAQEVEKMLVAPPMSGRPGKPFEMAFWFFLPFWAFSDCGNSHILYFCSNQDARPHAEWSTLPKMPGTPKNPPVHYRVEIGDLHAHLFRVTLTIAQPEALQRVSLPVWIPGSYLVREFSKNLQKLEARQAVPHAAARRAARQMHLAGSMLAGQSPWCCATRCMPTTTRCAPPGWMRIADFSTAPACA